VARYCERVLTLTENAASAIKAMAETEAAGLRISTEAAADDAVGIRIELAEAAVDGDEVVAEHGAKVYLDPGAALILQDQVLDANLGERVSFAISPRA
jgi:iron-sulfur cluster assembly protein